MTHNAEKGLRHFLRVTFEPVPEKDRAEYDAADDRERRDWDRDRRHLTVECAGLDQTCFGWVECREPHAFTDEEDDDGEGTSHGVFHQRFNYGWATEGVRCALSEFPDAWCDSADDLAEELGEGRHAIDFEWDDEYTILLTRVFPPGGDHA